ncbi:MAG: HAD-IA family hydrolase [Burkholderiales bacterium]
MASYDLIVFDWDGTLMDSTAVITLAVQNACADLGLPVPSEKEASHIIGLGLRDALTRVAPTLDPSDYPKMSARYIHHFHANEESMPLFDGAKALLERLRAQDYLIAIATGKSRKGLDRALEKTGIGPYFHASRCADECHSKPHPEMLHELMTQFNISPQRTLMIGDTTHDLQMAHNAQAHGLAVTYGAHPRHELQQLNPIGLIDDIKEFAPWLATRG